MMMEPNLQKIHKNFSTSKKGRKEHIGLYFPFSPKLIRDFFNEDSILIELIINDLIFEQLKFRIVIDLILF
jgi:hypothetical protein